jgi:hypothetical protein
MIRRLVVPVDFSEVSCRAAQYAVETLAPQLDAEVIESKVPVLLIRD